MEKRIFRQLHGEPFERKKGGEAAAGKWLPSGSGTLLLNHVCYHSDMTDLSSILKELITERDRLSAAIAALQGVSNGASPKGRTSKRRKMSAAARARIAAAQRARWAKVRAKKKSSQ